ncbi:hypothetical protein K502DRAFT_5762 [Neoconidiobolus thromboides FSU 785]|nr:hypothetical protein K502DRAFT_5762 [Neoconidiobolus thromboides FSU 785]
MRNYKNRLLFLLLKIMMIDLPDVILIEVFKNCRPKDLFDLIFLSKRFYSIVLEVITANYCNFIYGLDEDNYYQDLQKKFIQNKGDKVKYLWIYKTSQLEYFSLCKNIKALRVDHDLRVEDEEDPTVMFQTVMKKLLELKRLKSIEIEFYKSDYSQLLSNWRIDESIRNWEIILERLELFDISIESIKLRDLIRYLNKDKLKVLKIYADELNLTGLNELKQFKVLEVLHVKSDNYKVDPSFLNTKSFCSLKHLNIEVRLGRLDPVVYFGDVKKLQRFNKNGDEYNMINNSQLKENQIQVLHVYFCKDFDLNDLLNMKHLNQLILTDNEIFESYLLTILPKLSIKKLKITSLTYLKVDFNLDDILSDYNIANSIPLLKQDVMCNSVKEVIFEQSDFKLINCLDILKVFPNCEMVYLNICCVKLGNLSNSATHHFEKPLLFFLDIYFDERDVEKVFEHLKQIPLVVPVYSWYEN